MFPPKFTLNQDTVFKTFWDSLLLCSPSSYKLVDVFVLECQILHVLRACTVFTEKTHYTQKTLLAVVGQIEAEMSSIKAEWKEAGMLCSVPTLSLRGSNPQHLAGESCCAQRGSHLSLWLKKKELKINQAQEIRVKFRYTTECKMIKSTCKCNTGERRRAPGFCCGLCFWKLCTAQVKHGPPWCPGLLHEHALSSKSNVSICTFWDTLPGWESTGT